MRRAIELNPASAAAHKGLARALWNGVAEKIDPGGRAAPEQLPTLQDAIDELEKARRLAPHDEEIPFDLGTIARLRGDVSAAAIEYRRGAQLSQLLAVDGREPDWDFKYAIACLFAAERRFPEAFDELRPIIGKTKSWNQGRLRIEERNYRKWAKADPDFAAMRDDGVWGPKLLELVHELAERTIRAIRRRKSSLSSELQSRTYRTSTFRDFTTVNLTLSNQWVTAASNRVRQKPSRGRVRPFQQSTRSLGKVILRVNSLSLLKTHSPAWIDLALV